MSSSEQRHLLAAREIDAELAKVARNIRVLAPLQWPAEAEESFLNAWRAGRPELPNFRPVPEDHAADVEALNALQARCDLGHPVGRVLYKTARSYRFAAEMLGAIGTPEFTRLSQALYGGPDDSYRSQVVTARDAAEYFLSTTDDLLGGFCIAPTEAKMSSEVFGARLGEEVDAFFGPGIVTVERVPELASRAVANSGRIRLRASARFSELDLQQLLQHEAFVHSGTMLNGRAQPNFSFPGLGAPRTTRAQEGLAVFAELMSLSLDVNRLRRVALRVRAIHDALEGADFIEIFRGFLEAGQSEVESYQSTVRVFRGGDVRGKIVFTKDCVYCKGMLEVNAFLHVAIHRNRPELIRALFAGRFTLGDLVELEPLFADGTLIGPTHVPPWAADLRTLASVLAYSVFASRMDVDPLHPEDFLTYEDHAASRYE